MLDSPAWINAIIIRLASIFIAEDIIETENITHGAMDDHLRVQKMADAHQAYVMKRPCSACIKAQFIGVVVGSRTGVAVGKANLTSNILDEILSNDRKVMFRYVGGNSLVGEIPIVPFSVEVGV